jgi:hypothetical protein
VKSHVSMFVPGRNEPMLDVARRSVSCTRSSARSRFAAERYCERTHARNGSERGITLEWLKRYAEEAMRSSSKPTNENEKCAS